MCRERRGLSGLAGESGWERRVGLAGPAAGRRAGGSGWGGGLLGRGGVTGSGAVAVTARGWCLGCRRVSGPVGVAVCGAGGAGWAALGA